MNLNHMWLSSVMSSVMETKITRTLLLMLLVAEICSGSIGMRRDTLNRNNRIPTTKTSCGDVSYSGAKQDCLFNTWFYNYLYQQTPHQNTFPIWRKSASTKSRAFIKRNPSRTQLQLNTAAPRYSNKQLPPQLQGGAGHLPRLRGSLPLELLTIVENCMRKCDVWSSRVNYYNCMKLCKRENRLVQNLDDMHRNDQKNGVDSGVKRVTRLSQGLGLKKDWLRGRGAALSSRLDMKWLQPQVNELIYHDRGPEIDNGNAYLDENQSTLDNKNYRKGGVGRNCLSELCLNQGKTLNIFNTPFSYSQGSKNLPYSQEDSSQDLQYTKDDGTEHLPLSREDIDNLPYSREDSSDNFPFSSEDDSENLQYSKQDSSEELPYLQEDSSKELPYSMEDSSKMLPFTQEADKDCDTWPCMRRISAVKRDSECIDGQCEPPRKRRWGDTLTTCIASHCNSLNGKYRVDCIINKCDKQRRG